MEEIEIGGRADMTGGGGGGGRAGLYDVGRGKGGIMVWDGERVGGVRGVGGGKEGRARNRGCRLGCVRQPKTWQEFKRHLLGGSNERRAIS